jgi:hypothetical protein
LLVDGVNNLSLGHAAQHRFPGGGGGHTTSEACTPAPVMLPAPRHHAAQARCP